jgi:type I restriction enzyme M protein
MPKGRPKKVAASAGAAQPAKAYKTNGNGANLGFEAQLFLAADKLRKNLEPSDYKHVALGPIFLKHISNAFEAKRAALLSEDPAAAEDPDEHLAENVFWVPKGRAGRTYRPTRNSRSWNHLCTRHTVRSLIRSRRRQWNGRE